MSSNIKIQRICQHCGNEFIARTTVTRYCGDACSKKAYKLRKKSEKIKASNLETLATRSEEIRKKEFLTVRDASILLNCSIRTMYRLIANGTVKARNISQRKTLIKRSEIDQLFS